MCPHANAERGQAERAGKTGEATLRLAAASRGKAAIKSWSLRTTENGGMATLSRKCMPG